MALLRVVSGSGGTVIPLMISYLRAPEDNREVAVSPCVHETVRTSRGDPDDTCCIFGDLAVFWFWTDCGGLHDTRRKERDTIILDIHDFIRRKLKVKYLNFFCGKISRLRLSPLLEMTLCNDLASATPSYHPTILPSPNS